MTRLPKKRGITQVEEDKSLILRQVTGVYKISVDQNGCGYSCREADGKNFQRLGWTKLTENPAERITAITDALAECEARAQIDA
jgi:hypothetical protein